MKTDLIRLETSGKVQNVHFLVCSAWGLLFVGFFKYRTSGGAIRACIAHIWLISYPNQPCQMKMFLHLQEQWEIEVAAKESGAGKCKGVQQGGKKKKEKIKKPRQECSDHDLFSFSAFQLKWFFLEENLISGTHSFLLSLLWRQIENSRGKIWLHGKITTNFSLTTITTQPLTSFQINFPFSFTEISGKVSMIWDVFSPHKDFYLTLTMITQFLLLLHEIAANFQCRDELGAA